jgi:hypothetical protein
MLGLVRADAENFEVISSLKIKGGRGPHWSHPVIKNGRLYIRHGETLQVFDIAQK